MVLISDLTLAQAFASELDAIDVALANLANGGDVIAMTISNGPLTNIPEVDLDPPAVMGQSVSTLHIPHPSQMLTAIRTELEQRRSVVQARLAELGVSKPPQVEQPAPPSP